MYTLSDAVVVTGDLQLSSKSFTALTEFDSSTMRSLQKDVLVHSGRKYLSALQFFIYSKESEALTLHLEVSFHSLTSSHNDLLYGASLEVVPGKVKLFSVVLNRELHLPSDADVGNIRVHVFAKSKSRRYILEANKLVVRHDVVLQSTPEFLLSATLLESPPVSIKDEVKKSALKKNNKPEGMMPPDFMHFSKNNTGFHVPEQGPGGHNFPSNGFPTNGFPHNNGEHSPQQFFEQMMMARAMQQQQQQLAEER